MNIKTTIRILTSLAYIPHFIIFLCSRYRKTVEQDLQRNGEKRHSKTYANKGIKSYFFVLIRDKYYRSLFYKRVGSISRWVSWYSPGESTFLPNCPIGGGCFCIHSYATILHARSIGNNFSCRQCTTIGIKSDNIAGSYPTIGNNVTLGANVVIIGDINIGDNVIIGAGSVVVKDIPSNSIAVGNPAKVIKSIESKLDEDKNCICSDMF